MSVLEIFNRYDAALRAGDFATIGALFADDIVWHQPGSHDLAGSHVGRDAVFGLLGEMTRRSEGTLVVATQSSMVNGDLVAAKVTFGATNSNGQRIDMEGLDLFKIRNGLIVEVWLFSSDQPAEDAFWSASR